MFEKVLEKDLTCFGGVSVVCFEVQCNWYHAFKSRFLRIIGLKGLRLLFPQNINFYSHNCSFQSPWSGGGTGWDCASPLCWETAWPQSLRPEVVHSEQTRSCPKQTWPCPLLAPSYSFSCSDCHTNSEASTCVFTHFWWTLLTSSKVTGWTSVEAKQGSSDYPSEAAHFRYHSHFCKQDLFMPRFYTSSVCALLNRKLGLLFQFNDSWALWLQCGKWLLVLLCRLKVTGCAVAKCFFHSPAFAIISP